MTSRTRAVIAHGFGASLNIGAHLKRVISENQRRGENVRQRQRRRHQASSSASAAYRCFWPQNHIIAPWMCARRTHADLAPHHRRMVFCRGFLRTLIVRARASCAKRRRVLDHHRAFALRVESSGVNAPIIVALAHASKSCIMFARAHAPRALTRLHAHFAHAPLCTRASSRVIIRWMISTFFFCVRAWNRALTRASLLSGLRAAAPLYPRAITASSPSRTLSAHATLFFPRACASRGARAHRQVHHHREHIISENRHGGIKRKIVRVAAAMA